LTSGYPVLVALTEGEHTMTLRVEVHLHAGLLRYAPDSSGAYVREYSEGTRVSDVLIGFGLPTDRRIIIGIDGESATTDALLHDGARIDLVPPIAGG
jgi:hypothetical protein